MTKELIIVFVKNAVPGGVKTRLAKSIGDQAAFEIYTSLVSLTRNTVKQLEIDKEVYFSQVIESAGWDDFNKHLQKGTDLGERMLHAFQNGFRKGYERIILIGSDLPDISTKGIQKAFEALNHKPLVFGPAHDGGYYLIGMSSLQPQVFKNKAWSTARLLEETTKELFEKNITFSLLEPLNDIDTFEDLRNSSFYKNNKILQQKLKQYHGEDH